MKLNGLMVFVAVLLGTPALRAEKPNFILLMGDDHGWEETGYNGHPHVRTPTLDAMAASGLRLDRFYAAHPNCSPTRGSVLTGRHPNRYGTFTPNHSIRPEEVTIAHLLGDAGYQCGHFGKWHVGPVKGASPTNPGAMGFHEWLSHDNFFELNPTLSRNGGEPETLEGESSEIIVDEAIQFIANAGEEGAPFLAVIWFGSPHEPYSGLPDDLALYDDLPDGYANRFVRLTSNETGRGVRRPLKDVLRERYAEITAMDRAIGKLRDYLQHSGQRENTLLWYCGDNGTPSSGVAESPLRGQKGQLYEGGIRVPGVIEWPAKISQPFHSTVPSTTSDVLPTLCAAAGVEPSDRPRDGFDLGPVFEGTDSLRDRPRFFWIYEGPSADPGGAVPYIEPSLQQGTTPLVKLMNGKPTRTFRNIRRTTLVDEDYRGGVAVIAGDFKLISRQNAPAELYNLAEDGAEEKNLAGLFPDRVSSMSAMARRWQSGVLQSLLGKDYR